MWYLENIAPLKGMTMPQEKLKAVQVLPLP
jgi:hypothetical protein